MWVTAVNGIMLFFVTLFWVIGLVHLGVPGIFTKLGGSSVFYFILPLVVCANFRFKPLTKLIWTCVFTLLGFVLVNYLYSYFLENPHQYHLLLRVFLIWIPSSLVAFGFWGIMAFFWISGVTAEFEKKDHFQAFKGFAMLCGGAFSISVTVTVLIIMALGKEYPVASGYVVAFGSLIASQLFLVLLISEAPLATLNYFAKPVHRFDGNIIRVRNRTIIGTSILLLVSLHWEMEFRGCWFIWGETIILLVLYLVFLYQFARILFLPEMSSSDRLPYFGLPSIGDFK
jgi:hypothetical protein